jgi:hypothetical protein
VLEDNLPAVRVWFAVQTQWRIAMDGPSGLDYAVLPAVLGLFGIRKKRRGEVFAALRIMEGETLAVWRERRDREI